MPLLAFNISGSTVALAGGNPAPVLPPSPAPPAQGPVTDVTRELTGLSDAAFAALEAQRPNNVSYQWTSSPEFDVGTLSIVNAVGPHLPDLHVGTHKTGGTDPLQIVGTVGVNQATTGVNQATTGVNQTAIGANQVAPTGITSGSTTVVNSTTNSNVSVTNTVPVNQATTILRHEAFLAPVAVGVSQGTIDDNVANASPTTAVLHPTTLDVTFPAGWSGGNVQVDGTGVYGQAVTETFASTPSTTQFGAVAFATIDTSGITNTAPSGGGVNATVKVGRGLALAMVAGETDPVFLRILVGGLAASFTATDPTNRTFEPGPLKDGVNSYEVWYTTTHTHVQDTHNHGVSDGGHSHTQNAHNHAITDPGHTHTQDAHTHTQDTHNHVQNNHTHTQNNHTHTTSE